MLFDEKAKLELDYEILPSMEMNEALKQMSARITELRTSGDDETTKQLTAEFHALKLKEYSLMTSLVAGLNTMIRENAEFRQDLEQVPPTVTVLRATNIAFCSKVVPCDEQSEKWELPLLPCLSDDNDSKLSPLCEWCLPFRECSYCLKSCHMTSLRKFFCRAFMASVTSDDERKMKFVACGLASVPPCCKASPRWEELDAATKELATPPTNLICQTCLQELKEELYDQQPPTVEELKSGHLRSPIFVLYRHWVPSTEEGEPALKLFSNSNPS